jgi:hypothetical protein
MLAMDDFDRALVRVMLVLSLVSIALVALWLVLAAQATDASCDLFAGTEVRGKSSVSVFPPGQRCTYGGGMFVHSPSYLRLVVLAVAVGGLPLTWFMRRSLRH